MTDPFLQLVIDILNLTHPRFASAYGLTYTPEEADEPPAARKVRERAFVMEFYHEFRRLWDQAEPIRRGLGHLVLQSEPQAGWRTPDLLVWRLGERGASDSRLAALSFAFLSNPKAIAADHALLAKFRNPFPDGPGYSRAISVIVGCRREIPATGLPTTDGVVVLFFDTATWQALDGGR
ncbi:MAG: hypothetical protein RMJ56_05020 [Gemmataceae bacterium]|nr:hypothetical protein [Gemmata sp.]MDW8196952.1 hypothetical protein [Gemmataceae bacterium]